MSNSGFIVYLAFEILLFSFDYFVGWISIGASQCQLNNLFVTSFTEIYLVWCLQNMKETALGHISFSSQTKKRTAKILISIQYQQSSHLRYAKADYFCWTDSWTGDDAKLDRFLKRLEGAASHFGSPPQIRMALVCLVFTCSWTWERRWSQTQSRRWVWNLKDDLSLSWTLHCLSTPRHTWIARNFTPRDGCSQGQCICTCHMKIACM